ncbi:MAG: calcium/sodium antiporter [Kiritimatiellales bacterium]|nr:calcium/sodium antiporter [Kiritimatiellales bacterium]MCF7863489.1 calcium/sodium antiporter [Kiritimatiellales bacterium]
MEYFLLVVGLVLLVVGAESLVRGASKLAVAVGISPLVIGLTIVAFGTSAPEMAVSVVSGLGGQANIALGNVVGSNIFNTLFILGLAALIAPLVVAQKLIKLDVPVMIAVSILAFLFGLNGTIGRLEGVLLFTGSIAYTLFLVRQSRRETQAVQAEYAQEYGAKGPRSWKALLRDVLLILTGLGLLVLGSKWLVDGAVAIAQKLGVSDLVIGLTIVATGTSLPELATSVVASIRGERDIAVGNVVGSNIFNILAVLGLSGIVAPSGIAVSSQVLHFDLPVMVVSAVACLPIFFTGSRISRGEGMLFIGGYLAYMAFLIATVRAG